MANVKVQQSLSPQLTIDAVVNNVKSEGLFDNFRKECLEEFENLETYHQLKQRVENHVASFLSKHKYHDGLQKNTLRNNLRGHLSKSDVLLNSIQQLVDEVLSLKGHSICLRIDKQVDKYMNQNNKCSPTKDLTQNEITENRKSTENESQQKVSNGDSLDETKDKKDDFNDKNLTMEQNIVTTEVTEIEEVDMELAESIVTSESQDIDEQLLTDSNVDSNTDLTNKPEQSSKPDNLARSESNNLGDETTVANESISAQGEGMLKIQVNNVLVSEKDNMNTATFSIEGIENAKKSEKIQLSSFTASSMLCSDSPPNNSLDEGPEKNSRTNEKIQLSSFIGNLMQPSENQPDHDASDEKCSESAPRQDFATLEKSEVQDVGGSTEHNVELENESSKPAEDRRKDGLVLVIKTGDIIPPLVTEPISDDSASNHSSFYEEKFSFSLDPSKEEVTSNRRKSTRVRSLPLKLRDQEERSTKSEDTDSISSNDVDVKDTNEEIKSHHSRGRPKRHVLDSSTPESTESRSSSRKRSDKDVKKDSKRKRSDSPLTPVEERRSASRVGRHAKHSDNRESTDDKYKLCKNLDTASENNSYKRTRRPVKQRKCYSPS